MNGGNDKEKEEVYMGENKQNPVVQEKIVLEVKTDQKIKSEKKKGCCWCLFFCLF